MYPKFGLANSLLSNDLGTCCRSLMVSRNYQLSITYRQQQGYLMPLAVFILIVIGTFSLSVSKLSGRGHASVTLEAISSAAFFAAESGGQYAMNRIYYSVNTPISRTLTDSQCRLVDGETLDFNAPGLNGCNAHISCSITNNMPDNTISFYQITSQGRCGSGALSAERTINLASFLQGVSP